jgi:predicted dehydrogenase
MNWGILGPGRIARKFAGDLKLLPNARLHAVASSSSERARAFADEYAQTLDFPYEGHGYAFEAAHVQRCLENGRLESELLPLDFSLGLAETLDAVREKIGLAY